MYANGKGHSKSRWRRVTPKRRKETRETGWGGRGEEQIIQDERKQVEKTQFRVWGWTGAAAFKPPYALEPSEIYNAYVCPWTFKLNNFGVRPKQHYFFEALSL